MSVGSKLTKQKAAACPCPLGCGYSLNVRDPCGCMHHRTLSLPPHHCCQRRLQLQQDQIHDQERTAEMPCLACDALDMSGDRMSFSPFVGGSNATGFTSNQRPAIFYKPSLDLIDNPQFGFSSSDMFTSRTKRDYQLHEHPEHSLPLHDFLSKPRKINFHHLNNITKTTLLEDKTEYQRSFLPQSLMPSAAQNLVKMGPKEGTGFTKGGELQFNLQGDGNMTFSTVTKTDFVSPSVCKCIQGKPCMRKSCKESGYTKVSISPLTNPSSLLPSPPPGRKSITVEKTGKKEISGAVRNEPITEFPETQFDPTHFTTTYKDFTDDYAKRSSFVPSMRSIDAKANSGYTREGMDRYILRQWPCGRLVYCPWCLQRFAL